MFGVPAEMVAVETICDDESERGNKVIDESVNEWLAELRLALDQFENFVRYADECGATRIRTPYTPTAEFQNGWVASAITVQPHDGRWYVHYGSWCKDAYDTTYGSVQNDWRAAVDRAVSGGAS